MSMSTNSNIAQINFRPPGFGEELLPRCADTMLLFPLLKLASFRAQDSAVGSSVNLVFTAWT